VFVLGVATTQGDVILDFAAGDTLELAGFGAGAAVNHLGGGLWLASGAAGEASFMLLAGGSAVTALGAEDYAFV
jgi:hypothetical protein